MKRTIVVNGRKYDSHTGICLEPRVVKKPVSSSDIHSSGERSKILNRKYVDRPKSLTPAQIRNIEHFKKRHAAEERASLASFSLSDSSNKPRIIDSKKRFSERVVSGDKKKVVLERKNQDEKIAPAQLHPIEIKMLESRNGKKYIDDDAEVLLASNKVYRGSFWSRFLVFSPVKVGIFALMTMAIFAYFGYSKSPSISINLASAGSTPSVNFPENVGRFKRKDGIKELGNSTEYTFVDGDRKIFLKIAPSEWNSVALKDNWIDQNWHGSVMVSRENGISIFRNALGEASWVNQGKVFWISGENDISLKEIVGFASSV